MTELKIGNLVSALPDTFCDGVSARTDPAVSILQLGEIASLICSFFPSVTACNVV